MDTSNSIMNSQPVAYEVMILKNITDYLSLFVKGRELSTLRICAPYESYKLICRSQRFGVVLHIMNSTLVLEKFITLVAQTFMSMDLRIPVFITTTGT